jgi:hypothetical protein
VILSIPAPVVESTGGIALKAGLIGVVVKKVAPNQLLMEDAGNNEKAKNYVGTEFSLETG